MQDLLRFNHKFNVFLPNINMKKENRKDVLRLLEVSSGFEPL